MQAKQQTKYLNGSSSGSGSNSSKTLFKNFNNFMAPNIGNPPMVSQHQIQNNIPINSNMISVNQLSKSTIQSLEKLRNVRSLTPEKQQQYLINSQQLRAQ